MICSTVLAVKKSAFFETVITAIGYANGTQEKGARKVRKPWKSLLRKAPIHSRVVIICVCFMFFSMLVIGGYLSAMMYSKSYESTCEKMQIYTEKTVQNIDQSFSFISNTGLAVATGGTIGYWISNVELFDPENPTYYNNINDLKSETAHVLTYSNAWKTNYISYICILLNEEPLLYVSRGQMTPNSIYQSAIKANEALKESGQQFIGNIPPFVNGDEIYHVRIMKRDFSSEDSLAIIIATKEEVLYKEYAEFDEVNGVSSYLIDESGYIFSSSERELVGERIEESFLDAVKRQENGSINREGNDYLYFSKPLSANSLTLVNIVPKRTIMDQTFEGLPLLFVITGLLCILLLAIGFVVSFKSTSFIKDLVVCMDEVMKKNYDAKMPHYHNKSVDTLSQHFNDMTSAMKTLINDTYKAKIMRQEMELEFIQQQVNPHFLFNVLSTIQIKAKMCGDETVYQMLTSLSGLLRASLYSGKNTMTSLLEEVKYAEFYLYLQKQRYNDRLNYCIDMDQSLEKFQIPRLTLEPIVENSVVHGMEGVSDRVTISVKIFRDEQDVVIRVEDDGCGFDVDALDLSGEDVTLDGGREKVGLKNTHCRLVMLYGEGYGLKIHSGFGQGTMVEIRIPWEQRGREEQ